MESHEKTPSISSISPFTAMSPQITASVFFLQKHEAEMRTRQGLQAPVWQTRSQRWRPQERRRLHSWPQVNGFLRSEHRRTMVFFPHGHGRRGAKALQGGQGPGWHWRTHT